MTLSAILGAALPLVASVLVSVGTVVAGYFVARRFQKMGGGEAQDRLNRIRQEVADAAEERVKQLEDEFTGCKSRLIEVEATVKMMRRERIALRQEIDDLYAELRSLRPDRAGRQDRVGD